MQRMRDHSSFSFFLFPFSFFLFPSSFFFLFPLPFFGGIGTLERVECGATRELLQRNLKFLSLGLHFLDGVLRMSTYRTFLLRNKVKHNLCFEERRNHTVWGQARSFLSNRSATQILRCEFFISVCFEMHQPSFLENKAKHMLLLSKSEFTLF